MLRQLTLHKMLSSHLQKYHPKQKMRCFQKIVIHNDFGEQFS